MSAENDYQKLIKDIGFIEKLAIKKDFVKKHFIVRGEIKRRDVLLKITSKDNKNRVKQFSTEVIVDKILEQYNEDLRLPLIVKTKILGFGRNRKYEWIIRRYYPGSSLASYAPHKSLFGYDIIRVKFLFRKKKIISQIVENLLSVYMLSKRMKKIGINKDSFNRRFPIELNELDQKKIEEYLAIDLSNHKKIIKKNKIEYYKPENIKACIGDLTPANIIIREDGQLVFSDFEQFCFDNYTVDIAYLWMFLWRSPDWQKELVIQTIKSDKDREFFRVSLIRIIFMLYDWPYNSVAKKPSEDRKEYLKKHVWTKYLIAAGESFEAIMKVKK